MDSLSYIVQSLGVKSQMHARTLFRAPWAVYMPQCDSVPFHFIVDGECRVKVPSIHCDFSLKGGGFIFFPHGASHIIADSLTTSPVNVSEMEGGESAEEYIEELTWGGQGKECRVICGNFNFTGPGRLLIGSKLPPVVRVESSQKAFRDKWLQQTLDLMFKEAKSPSAGSSLMINSLLDILFIQTLRNNSFQLGTQGHWLLGLQEEVLQKPLYAIHHQPECQWTVESLAATAGMSRASFAHSFKKCLGDSPLNYLNRWRISCALEFIGQKQLNLKEIAGRCGFNSPEVFNRTFRRYLGISPARYKKQQSVLAD